MSQHTPDGRAIVAALGKLTAQVKRVADAKRSDFALTPDAPTEAEQAATEAAQLETTARAFAGLHQSAEQDVTRVIALYEQWVKAGPPPLGASMARWWDARLVELHEAISPTTDQPKES